MVEMPNTKHFDSDDKSLKELGELLTNDSSRKIIRAIISKPMFLNEIARVTREDPPLVKHHMKKLESLGVLEITYKDIVRKGKLHKHYQMIPNLFVTPNHTKEEVKEQGIFKKIFKDTVKITSIVIASFISWLIFPTDIQLQGDVNDSIIPFATIPCIVIIIGLGIMLILEKKIKKMV